MAQADFQTRRSVRLGHAAISTALPDSLTRITGPIGAAYQPFSTVLESELGFSGGRVPRNGYKPGWSEHKRQTTEALR